MSATEGRGGMENLIKADVKIVGWGGSSKLWYIILFTFTDANPAEFLPLINFLGGHFGLKVPYRWQNFKSTKYVRIELEVLEVRSNWTEIDQLDERVLRNS